MTIVAYCHTFFGCHGSSAIEAIKQLTEIDISLWIDNTNKEEELKSINKQLRQISHQLKFDIFPMSYGYEEKDIPYFRIGKVYIVDGEDSISHGGPGFEDILFEIDELKDIINIYKALKHEHSKIVEMGICTLAVTKEL